MADREELIARLETDAAYLERIDYDTCGTAFRHGQSIVANIREAIAALSAPTMHGWTPITEKNERMTCRFPPDETVVDVMLRDGDTMRAWFSCNIMDAGDWDFVPATDDGEPDDEADSIADKVVAWRILSSLSAMPGEAVAWQHVDHPDALRTHDDMERVPSSQRAQYRPLYASPVPAEPSAEGWRPLDTAPRDGSLILLATKRVYPSVHPARWRGTDADAVNFHYWDAWQHWFLDDDLIGWLPLPPAPHGEGA